MNYNKIDPHGRTLYGDSVLNVIVSGHRGVHADNIVTYPDGTPGWFNLGKILLNDPPSDVAELQAAIRSETDPDKRDVLKRSMLAITPAAFVTPPRKAANVQYLTGLMPFDIDAKDNAGHLLNYDELKEVISQLPYVAYCGRSVSGKGFWGLFHIGYNVTASEYKAAFRALQEDFADMGIIIDPAPANPASLRFYSFDPDAYVNHYPQVYERRYIAPTVQQAAQKSYTPTTMHTGEASQRPGDWFNANHSCVDILTAHCWQIVRQTPTQTDLRRPGAKTNNHDATVYHDNGKVKIWSTSAGLPTDGELTPFQLLAALEHSGDWKAAAKALRAQM